MPLFTNLVKSFFSQKRTPPDHQIVEVPATGFIHREVISREECLVLYAPTSDFKCEIVLYSRIESFSTSKAFSLARVQPESEARRQFEVLARSVVPLGHCQDLLTVENLTFICQTLAEFPSWSASHIAAFLDFHQAFNVPEVKKSINDHEPLHGKSPLHLAIQKDSSKAAYLLLSLGANGKAADHDGNTICHLAAAASYSVIKLVIDQSAGLLNLLNHNGQTALHLACEKNNPEYVKQLLAAGADFGISGTNRLPIHSAISSNSTACAKEIIKSNQNQLHVGDKTFGDTPLHWARSKEMVAALIEYGCLVDARNQKSATPLHKIVQLGELLPVLELLINGAKVDIQDIDGNTPLHYVTSLQSLQCLLVFGADIDVLNEDDESALHRICISDFEEKQQMMYCLHAIGVRRCSRTTESCGTGCSYDGDYIGISPHPEIKPRERQDFDHFLDQVCSGKSATGGGGRVLCLDGGGIKGLVLIQILEALFRLNPPDVQLSSLFDWIGGTSTGGVMALALASGKSLSQCRFLYLRLKNAVFSGSKPYPSEPIEKILKQEFGESTRMSSLRGDLKVFVTAVKADCTPADLELFRNYSSPKSVYLNTVGDRGHRMEEPDFFVWEAARATSAAPTYFKPYKGYVDGGLISNNPTLDVITEVFEYAAVHNALLEGSKTNVKHILSIGVGKPPAEKADCPELKYPLGIVNLLSSISDLQGIAKLLIDQATMCDNHTVDRSRAWCSMSGINYLRLTPQLSQNVELDENDERVLIDVLWQTMAYCYDRRAEIRNFHQKIFRN